MRKNCSSKQYKNKGTFNLIRKEIKMKYLVFSTGKWEWVKGSGWETPVSVYNKVEVYDETKRKETQKYVRFYNYNEATDFTRNILNLINEGYLEIKWKTCIWFNTHDTETITVWELLEAIGISPSELLKIKMSEDNA